MKIKRYFFTLVLALFFGHPLQATSQTLPKGIWQLNFIHNKYNFTQVAASEDQGNSYKFVPASGFLAKHVPLFSGYIALGLDSNTPLVKYYTLKEDNLSVAYGMTDKLSLSVTVPYITKRVKYNEYFVSQMKTLNGIIDSQVIVPPSDGAKADGIGNISIAGKYKLSPQLSLAASVSAGFLKTGRLPRDLVVVDNKEELATGKQADLYTVAVLHDKPMGDQLLKLFAAYEISGKGYEWALDNKYPTDRGDILTLSAAIDTPLTDTVTFTPHVYYLRANTDKKLDTTNKWVSIKNSKAESLYLRLQFTYQPKIYFNAWCAYEQPMTNSAIGGNYEFPGRLGIGENIAFGLTAYMK